MVMDGYYAQERLPELWTKINSLHLSYLQMEESPKKIEHRNMLEDRIKEFLCIAPHSQKFYFKEAAEVLHRSASSKKDFSGYKAALGWSAIGMYAGNLIAQPWRKEYREIKMYSGFYKHQIEANLVGAEIMFEAMGYKHAGNGILVLEGPVCPDRVTNVSQDSLVAYVECQILKEIWEDVGAASFNITWLEVLEFRETYLCSPRKSVEALKYQIQQRQYQEHHRSYSQGNNDFLLNNCRYPSHVHVASPTLPTNHSFPPLTGHSHVPMSTMLPPPPSCVYSNGYNYGTYGILPTHYTYPPNASYGMVKQPYNNFYCNGFVQPHYTHPVPTGQLIEIDPNQTYDTPDGVSKTPNENYTKNGITKNIPKTRDESSSLENWDYVYRNLESQGYSKDLGERGDVLSSPYVQRDNKPKEYELKVADRPLKINEALEKIKLLDRAAKREIPVEPKLPDVSLSSSYENITSQDLKIPKSNKSLNAKIKANIVDKLEENDAKKSLTKAFDLTKRKTEKPKSKDCMQPTAAIESGTGNKWQCKACTYLNDGSVTICDMCGKSKVIVNHEMEIGGSECSQCTLVNPKDKKDCEACGASLHNSPTYI